MILTDILTVLESDSELQSLLNGNDKINAFSTTKLDSIVYKYDDLSSDKIIGQARLTLTVNTKDIDYHKNIQIVNKVKELLLTFGDDSLNENILEIHQNGGGILNNDETKTIHNKIIFTIKYKERI